MKYFTKDTIDFFNELAFNNERKWFEANKDRYNKSVKEPFELFTADVIAGIKKFDPDVAVEDPKKVIYRIYRDVRFSKDKTPYKTHVGFGFGRTKKDYNWPGYTLGIGADNGLSIGGGIYHPEKVTLAAIRTGLAKDPAALNKLLASKGFKSHWGKILGDKNKILKKPFKEAALENPLIYNKQWVFWKDTDAKLILSDDLLKTVLADFKAGAKINDYFKQFCK